MTAKDRETRVLTIKIKKVGLVEIYPSKRATPQKKNGGILKNISGLWKITCPTAQHELF
jgi:hypothetical protein